MLQFNSLKLSCYSCGQTETTTGTTKFPDGILATEARWLCSVALVIYNLFTNAVNSADCVPSKSRIGA
jgi:hypothetical protein